MKYLFLAGAARVGKDSLCKILIEKFEKLGLTGKRFALADELKEKISPFVEKEFGFSAFTDDTELKSLVRPLLVAFGGAKRAQSQGTYWTSLLEKKMEEDSCDVAIITDIRYDFYPENDEIDWAQSKDGIIIHITRYNKNGSPIPYINADEAENDPKLRDKADFALHWKSFIENPDELKKVDNLFEKLINHPLFTKDRCGVCGEFVKWDAFHKDQKASESRAVENGASYEVDYYNNITEDKDFEPA